jgi:hypothetical protein
MNPINSSEVKQPKYFSWIGWALSAVPIVMMVAFPTVYLLFRQQDVASSMSHYGYPLKFSNGIFIAEICSAVLYAIPQTSVFGAILITGYLGGAVATHVRADELPMIGGPILFASLAWLGLFFRDSRLRQLVPWRR